MIHYEIVDLGCVHQTLLGKWLMEIFVMAVSGWQHLNPLINLIIIVGDTRESTQHHLWSILSKQLNSSQTQFLQQINDI